MSQQFVPYETVVELDDERLIDPQTIVIPLSIPMLQDTGVFSVRGLSIPNSNLELNEDGTELTITFPLDNQFFTDDKISGHYFSKTTVISVSNSNSSTDEQQGVMSDNELDGMVAEAARWLPTNVTILRGSGGDNAQGGESSGKDIVGDNVPARLAPMSTRALLANAADRESVQMAWIMTVPAFTDVEPEDEIIWKTRRFIVISPLERDYEVTRRLILEEIVD